MKVKPQNNHIFSKKRTGAMSIFVVALVLFVIFACFWQNPSVAIAVSPDGYVNDVVDNDLDWYMGENYLNLAHLKEIVGGWFESEKYDFSSLESDPVVIAVIDTGINSEHEIFTGRYDENGAKTSDEGIGEYDVLYRDSGGRLIAKNTVESANKDYGPDFSVSDDASDRHGTHVAGIIATFIHELNLEKYVKIMPIKSAYPVSGGSSFSTKAFRDGLDFALLNGADVINMSLASSSSDFKISSPYTDSAVCVAAAGNGEKDILGVRTVYSSDKKPFYPAASDGVVGVVNYTKSSDGSKVVSQTSNYGSKYELCAPGTDYFSADGSSVTKDGYKSLSGTSMATPVVSFGAALAIVQDRARSSAGGEELLSPKQIANKLVHAVGDEVKKSGGLFGTDEIYGAFDFCALLNDGLSVKIKSEGELHQLLSDVSNVKLSLSVYPEDLADKGQVEWYIRHDDGTEELIGNGFDVDYTPQNSVHSVSIYAKWFYESEEGLSYRESTMPIVISVDYVEYKSEEIAKMKVSAQDENGNEVSRLVCQVGEEYTLSINGFLSEYTSPQTDVQWYVNGKLSGVGERFIFKPSEMGEYTIVAKINGNYTSGVSIKVGLISEETADALTIFTIAASCAIALGFSITMLVAIGRRRRGRAH